MSTEDKLGDLIRENARKMLELSDAFLAKSKTYLGGTAEDTRRAHDLVGAAVTLRAAVIK